MNCINCYKEIPEDTNFCPYCGAQQAAPASAPEAPVQPEAATPTPEEPVQQEYSQAEYSQAEYSQPIYNQPDVNYGQQLDYGQVQTQYSQEPAVNWVPISGILHPLYNSLLYAVWGCGNRIRGED